MLLKARLGFGGFNKSPQIDGLAGTSVWCVYYYDLVRSTTGRHISEGEAQIRVGSIDLDSDMEINRTKILPPFKCVIVRND